MSQSSAAVAIQNRVETYPVAVDTNAVSNEISRKQIWTGRILSGLAVLFLAFDTAMKLFEVPVAIEGTKQLGYQPSVIFTLGVIQLVCLIAYVVPRTAVFGAILWTGYLGGAVATHVRAGNPLFSHILFPVYVAALLWLGLWLRDRRVRALLPIAK